MTNKDPFEHYEEATALDPRESAVGIRQGAGFPFDPTVFLWFKSLSDFRRFILQTMPDVWRPDGLEESEASLQEDLAALLEDPDSWANAMALLNEVYERESPTNWIGTFEELAFNEHSELGAELRAEFRERYSEDRQPSEIGATPLVEDELEDFAEFLRGTGE